MEETIHVEGISNLEIVQQRVSAANENDSTTAATHIVPLVYIQPNKVQHTSPLNQQISTSALQIVNSSTSTAAIINPINAPITAQNKVFIQGPHTISLSSKQHYVIRQPITASVVTTAPTSTQVQKHILVRKPAHILPLNKTPSPPPQQSSLPPVSPTNQINNLQSGKHNNLTFINTYEKPIKPRMDFSMPIPTVAATTAVTGTLSTNQAVVPKSKVVISPVQTAGQTSTTVSGSPAKNISNFLLPVNISPPGLTESSKQNVFNLKVTNGKLNNSVEITTTSNSNCNSNTSKGAITVLRESSKSSSSSNNPPPLHPITKINLLNKNAGINLNSSAPPSPSTDGIKITENPDSAVITPIPNNNDNSGNKNDEYSEKRKKTVSNILSRGPVAVTEKRPKKQNLSKTRECPEDNELYDQLDIPQLLGKNSRDKKSNQNDDEITLIKVIPSQTGKSNKNINNKSDRSSTEINSVDDDIKIEMIKSSSNVNSSLMNGDKQNIKSNNHAEEVNGNTAQYHNNNNNNNNNTNNHNNNHRHPHNDSNFDVTKALEWKDGVGSLPGSTLKFCINEFGLMEVVDDDNSKQDKHNNIGDKENVCLSPRNSFKPTSAITITSTTTEKKNEEKKNRNAVSSDTLYCCENCGCYGLAAEFDSPISCSPACSTAIEDKKQLQLRREKDARESKIKRKKKKLLQEKLTKTQQSEQEHEESEQKDDKKEQIEIKSDPSRLTPKVESDDDTSINNLDETSRQSGGNEAATEPKYPWQTGKLGFSWAKYLEYTKAKPAPLKLFKDPFPYGKNLFKVGMKLEGIDPEHPSRYCVLTVFEVVGYRIRLHFDGYPENFDFWVNSDSIDIFPVGWSEKHGHRLNPPKGYVPSNFNWNAYLKTCKATPAPKVAFSNHKSTTFAPVGFRVGMKLEAVDRKHSPSVCVASIAGVMDSRILVHFDSWDEVYDYWAYPNSPYIHPVGWCHHNGHSLTPPNNYKDSKSFTWDAYLRETRSVAAPSRAFKQRAPLGFKRGMKLEAVDRRVPQLIRVATIEDVKDHMIKIRFDGWSEVYSYWIDDDSPDIHPMTWCSKTGHPLEAPLTPELLNERTECGTPGCRGVGHVKGPKFATHNSASGCPYSPQNLHKIRMVSDRLNVKHEICDYDEDSSSPTSYDFIPKTEKSEKVRTSADRSGKHSPINNYKSLKLEKDIKPEDYESDHRQETSERSKKFSKHNYNNSDAGQSEDDDVAPPPLKKRRKKRQVSEESNFSLPVTDTTGNLCGTNNIPDKQLRTEIHQSVFNPGYNPLPDAPHMWAKHSNALNRVVAKQNTNPRRWSNEEVIKFISNVPNCKEVGSIFRKHSIDGEAFLMLTQEDLVSLLGLRLGPAIKLYNSIVLLRRKAT
ncbi:Similar to L3MBTL3: Lethal(3)malignant brain tumor-like protein 3 (Homo sapiens) [Cotesia congregata]|uniref:Similar to L3MBTL3: Lethal(3)malignant brain tumor-like protein 3 (Homo sapiens) n=1 Tax=Cotesia congregata TaxID=51543 RepID=A0A8J2MV36_COTCN|nr:Similar to L3MBTL3: Lethal(3)malignant brain tumor-like protein 3 (Homo sapiens) [Cotesia congregata]